MEARKVENQEEFSKGFANFFKTPIDSFVLDLSKCSVIEVMRQHEAFMRKLKSPNYTHSAVITLISEVEDLSGGQTLYPEQVNGIFYGYLYDYCINGKKLEPSSTKEYFRKISAALSWGMKYGANVKPGYADFNVVYNPKEKYALSFEEVCLIYNFDLSKLVKMKEFSGSELQMKEIECLRKGKVYTKKDKRRVKIKIPKVVPLFRKEHMEVLQRVKDQFVLSCMLFQRYSDMRKVSRDNFSEDGLTYKVVQQKSGSLAVVHIKDISISPDITFEILKRYDFEAPYKVHTNSFNKHLKELLQLIGGRFLEDVIFMDKQFGEVKKTVKKLWECITSHTARRTAITLATKTHNEFEIRKASGHKDGRSFAMYICDKK